MLNHNLTFSEIESNLAFFHKMYDAVRLVDPIVKKIIQARDYQSEETNGFCYDYWEKGKICDNCISVRAYMDNKCYTKLEQSPDVIMMVTAFPVENAERPVVLELLKNATETLMIGSGSYSDGYMIRNLAVEINDMVIKDKLTGIYNRRYVDERLPVDVVKATLDESPLSVIFMDVDNLKEINDTYGHAFGDKTLVEVKNVLSACILNEKDWVARYGGDEFLICLNNTANEEAYQISERIRSEIAQLEIPMQNVILKTTVSSGVHTMQGIKLTAEEIISLADNKMYQAKHKGKNCSVGMESDTK